MGGVLKYEGKKASSSVCTTYTSGISISGTITYKAGNVSDEYAEVFCAQNVTINGVPYAKGAIIHTIDTGVYEVICTDERAFSRLIRLPQRA